jgi:geranylgeranyl diphosphate synthase type I
MPEFRTRIDAALEEFVARRRAELADLGPDLDAVIDAAHEFVVAGKRLRPQFCVAGWLIADLRRAPEPPAGAPDPPQAVIEVAAALEWLQASALIHDDLIDESDTRRGRASIHRAFADDHQRRAASGDADRFGTAAAVLIGDLTLTWCDQMIVEAGLADGLLAGALQVLATCKNEVVAGQYLDVLAQTKPAVGVAEAMRVITYKSAKYTVERPLHLGAVLAGADDGLLESLSAVALPLGAAFQLRDDVLGVFGDPSVTGKPAGDDLREGKATVLVARTHELADDAGRGLLARTLGTADGVEQARDLIVSSGALAAVEADIAAQAALAAGAIAALGPQAQRILGPLLEQATARQR